MQRILVTLYCFEPQPPQNFAVGFSFFPQLLQDEDVSFFLAGFLSTYLLSYSSRSCLLGFGVPDLLPNASKAPTTTAAATPAIMRYSGSMNMEVVLVFVGTS